MAQAGACWRDAGVARRAGHVARVLRCAGCHGLRKVCEREWGKFGGQAGKQSGVFGAILGRKGAGRARRRAARLDAAARGHGAGPGLALGLAHNSKREWQRIFF